MKFIPNIPKFQDPASALPSWFNNLWTQKSLSGWNTSLDTSSAGLSIKNQYHGKAGDLNTVFSSMQDYVGNKGNVSADILDYATSGNYTDINSFLNAYNQDINKLNTFFKSDRKYGDTAGEHNQLFKKLYKSRSLDTGAGTAGNLGYQEGLENKLGSTTWLRRGDLYEKEFDALTDAEKADRTHKVNIGGTDYNVYKKADGTLGVLPNSDDNTPAAAGNTPAGTATTGNNNAAEGITPATEYKAETFDAKPKEKKLTWSDWIPLTMNHILDLLNNLYLSQLQKKMVFPRKEAPFKQKKVTNNYFARTQLNQQASEARSRAGTQNLTSDINLNLRIRNAAEIAGLDLNARAAGMKADKFERTTAAAEQVANENNAVGTQVANENAVSNAAAMNNIINANMKQSEANTGAFKLYVNDMYTNYGEFLKAKRYNDALSSYALSLRDASKRLQEARDLYNKNTSDISSWNQYNTMLAEALKPGNDFDQYTDLNTGWGSANDYLNGKTKLTDDLKIQLNNWFLNSSSLAALRWRTNWNQYLKQQESLLTSAQQSIMDRLGVAATERNKMITNQWDLPLIFQSQAHVSPIHKSGGRMSRLSDFTELIRKEREGVRRDSRRRNDSIQKSVDKRLTQLNQQQLILLKAVFK